MCCALASTLTPASARAFNCCSVAVTGLSVCVCGESWMESSASASAGVKEDVDLRGGMLGRWLWVWIRVNGCACPGRRRAVCGRYCGAMCCLESNWARAVFDVVVQFQGDSLSLRLFRVVRLGVARGRTRNATRDVARCGTVTGWTWTLLRL